MTSPNVVRGGSPFRQTEGSQRDGYPASTAGRQARAQRHRAVDAPVTNRHAIIATNRAGAYGPCVSARSRGLSATRGMEPAHYVSERAVTGIAGVGAVACPRPGPEVMVVNGRRRV